MSCFCKTAHFMCLMEKLFRLEGLQNKQRKGTHTSKILELEYFIQVRKLVVGICDLPNVTKPQKVRNNAYHCQVPKSSIFCS